jgi:hypothetical protein
MNNISNKVGKEAHHQKELEVSTIANKQETNHKYNPLTINLEEKTSATETNALHTHHYSSNNPSPNTYNSRNLPVLATISLPSLTTNSQ